MTVVTITRGVKSDGASKKLKKVLLMLLQLKPQAGFFSYPITDHPWLGWAMSAEHIH